MSDEFQFTGYPIEDEDREGLIASSVQPDMAMMGEMPERVDPRKHSKASLGFLRVENQGSIGSCQGNALTEAAEYAYMIATGRVIQFSRMFAYIASQICDRINGDKGSTLSGGSRAASQIGFVTEELAPYPRSYPGHGFVTASLREEAAKMKLQSHTTLKTVRDTQEYIGGGLGIVNIGIAWNSSCTPDRQGIIRNWNPNLRGGGHAVALAGYLPGSDIGISEGVFLLKNSWSERWGIRGYAFLPFSQASKMFQHRFTVFVGRSSMAVPTPRPIPVDFTKPGNSMYA